MEKIKKFIHHLFVPNENNNFRAKALHHDFLTSYLIFAFFLVFLFKNFSHHFKNVLGFATDITAEKLYQLTNKERENYGLPPLAYNEKLSQAANRKAQDMFAKNYWAHYAPDGTTPWDFILSTGYKYEFAGENLAKNFLFSQGVVDAWMNSQTHRGNILRKEYSEVGFAVVNGILNGEETTLVVQMFGKPQVATLVQTKKEVVPQTNNIPNTKPLVNNIKPVKSTVLSKQIATPKISFSIEFIYLFIFFLSVVLVTDFYFASKMNIFRITGKNIAHFIFLGFVFLGLLLFFTKGAFL